MRLSEAIRPIEYLRDHTVEAIRHVAEQREMLVITENGQAKAVVQDVATYEQTQESLALLKILALSAQSVAAGRVKPLDEAFRNLRGRIEARARA